MQKFYNENSINYIHLCMVIKGTCVFATKIELCEIATSIPDDLRVVSRLLEHSGIPKFETGLSVMFERINRQKLDVLICSSGTVMIGKNNNSVKKFGRFLESLRLFL